MAGEPKRSNMACRHAWRFTSGWSRRSRPLNASKSNAHRWIAPGLEPGEVRTAVGIAGHNLAVEHCRLGRQLVQQLRNGREPLREIVPIAAVDDYARAHVVDLHTVAVELHLMQPVVAGGHFLGADWAAGWDKAERGHALGCSGIDPGKQEIEQLFCTQELDKNP